MKRQTFLGGVLILTLGGLFAKALGAVYKIPLTWILKAEGLGVLQLAFPLFSLFLVISSSAMPTAISQMIALRQANQNQAKQILRVSLKFLTFFGGFFCLLLFLLSDFLASWQNTPILALAFKVVAPAILFASFISAFRGYFQGLLNMVPTMLSNVLEQFFKLLLGLLFAFLFAKQSFAFGAVGALFGICLAELFALLFLVFTFFKEKKKMPLKTQNTLKENDKKILKELLKSFFVIGGSSLILPLSIFLDSFLVLKCLQVAGFSLQTSTMFWGIESGVVSSFLNIPVVFCLAISSALVPNLAATKNKEKQISQSFFLALFVSIPFFVLLFFLSSDLIFVLFGFGLSGGEIFVASNLLCFSSFLVVISSVVSVQNAIFQGLGKNFVPLLSMLFGFFAKILVFLFLVPNKNFGIFGVEISKYVFFLCSLIVNFAFFKSLNLKISVLKPLLPNMFSCFFMGLCLAILNQIDFSIGIFWVLILKIFVATATFFVGIFVFSPVNSVQKWRKIFHFSKKGKFKK